MFTLITSTKGLDLCRCCSCFYSSLISPACLLRIIFSNSALRPPPPLQFLHLKVVRSLRISQSYLTTLDSRFSPNIVVSVVQCALLQWIFVSGNLPLALNLAIHCSSSVSFSIYGFCLMVV